MKNNTDKLNTHKNEEKMNNSSESKNFKKAKAWRPGIDQLTQGETLDYEPECYDLYSRFNMEWPSLSFSILSIETLKETSIIPSDIYLVSGTQAAHNSKNKIYVIRWTNQDEDFLDNSDSESEDNSSECVPKTSEKVLCHSINHEGIVNRIKSSPQIPRLIANWSDTGNFHIWDISFQIDSLVNNQEKTNLLKNSNISPLFTYESHDIEGYALDWNPHSTGMLVAGDCNGYISLWEPKEGGWSVSLDKKKFKHNGSVEDIQWKLNGGENGFIFATGCTDGYIRTFDLRIPTSIIQEYNAADHVDINVINWNPLNYNMIVSGDDSGCCKVWDIRFPQIEIAKLHYHDKPITSICWHPADDSTFASSCYDDSISIWDLSLEADDEFQTKDKDLEDIPDQLLFQHMGQKEISEIYFHKNYPGVIISTASCGFNIFKTFNIN